jgi:hypothetical protein
MAKAKGKPAAKSGPKGKAVAALSQFLAHPDDKKARVQFNRGV